MGRHSFWLSLMHLKHLSTKQPLLTDLHKFSASIVWVIYSQLLVLHKLVNDQQMILSPCKLNATTLPAIQPKTSPISIGQSPWFLSNGINNTQEMLHVMTVSFPLHRAFWWIQQMFCIDQLGWHQTD